jgi:hypothetical protein
VRFDELRDRIERPFEPVVVLLPLTGEDTIDPTRPGIPVGLRALPGKLWAASRRAAIKATLELCAERSWAPGDVAAVDPDLYQRELEQQLIFRAYLDADTLGDKRPAHFFAEPAQVGELDTVTQGRAMALFLEHQASRNPVLRLAPEEVERVVAALGKSDAPSAWLGVYDAATLRRCVLTMASMQAST